MTELRYLTDGQRHLICVPYSLDNLHRMAADLGIGRHWFHRPGKVHRWVPHYDIPKRRQAEVEAQCELVTTRALVAAAGAAIEAGTAGFSRGS